MGLNCPNVDEINIEEKTINFEDGIPGFEEHKEFIIINNHDENNPFIDYNL